MKHDAEKTLARSRRASRLAAWTVGRAAAVLSAVVWAPLLFRLLGAAPPVARSMGLLVFGLAGWGTGALHQSLVSVLILIFIPALGLGDFDDAVAGFGEPFVWLLVSVFILGKGMETSGLDRRIALALLHLARGRTRATLRAVYASVVVLGFLVPTGAGRTAMLTPICTGLLNVIQERLPAGTRDFANLGKSVFIGFSYVTLMMSWALVTGSVSSVYAVPAIRELTGFEWNYLTWMAACAPAAVIFTFLLDQVMARVFPVRMTVIPGGLEYIAEQRQQLGAVGPAERRVMVIMALIVLGWMTEGFHGLPVPMISLAGAALMCLPPVGVQRWEDAATSIKWDVIILFGTGFSLAQALQKSGAAAWMAQTLAGAFPALPPGAAGLFVLVVMLLARLGFANMLAILATSLPVAVGLGNRWGINPVWLAQLAVIASSFGFFMPYQAPSLTISYSAGFYHQRDLLRAGIGAAALMVGVTMVVSLVWWPMLGIKP
ncbi:MAG: anion permease [Firmicutes bacterium]|nr:anion permease [Bacillota bacterium]